MPRASGGEGKEQTPSILSHSEYSEVTYEMKYFRFHKWLVGSRASIILLLGKHECAGVRNVLQRCFMFQAFFHGEKVTMNPVLSKLMILYLISTINQILVTLSRKYKWYK